MRPSLITTLAAACLLATQYSFAEEAQTTRQFLQRPEMAELNLPFSDAVLVGDTLYLSGAGGIDLDTMKPPEDPKEEVRLLMKELQSTLALADMTLENIVSVTVYCPDLALYQDFNSVYREYFPKGFPARAFIGSGPLLFGMRFEVQAIAVK